MAESVETLIRCLTRLRAQEGEFSLVDELGRLILRREAKRLVERLARIESGRFEFSDAEEFAALGAWLAASADPPVWSLLIVEPFLRQLPEPFPADAMRFLSDLLASDTAAKGSVRILSTSLLRILDNTALLRFALQAVARELDVRVDALSGSRAERPVELTLSTSSYRLVCSAEQSAEPSRAGWSVEVWPAERLACLEGPDNLAGTTNEAVILLPSAPVATLLHDANGSELETSVADLFGDFISLRDLQPRSSHMRGLDDLRAPLGLGPSAVPRKNEQDYARVVGTFVADLAGNQAHILYVGDTVFNDGSVICNLHTATPGSVWGFICSEKGFGAAADFILGPVYFANRWRSLTRFLLEGRRRGLALDRRTVALFDLDQTVYAAKGRDDEALHNARWDAIARFLQDTIPSYKFDLARCEQIYRQFDQDEYHRLTRDNMDYVVVLVLAVAAGLCDAREIESLAAAPGNSMTSLTEILHQRAVARKGHEKIQSVVDVIRAVYYNTLAGDQTPCKDFRRHECLATAQRMRAEKGKLTRDRICLNREVVDFIRFLKDQDVFVLAVSDRPPEAAVVEDEIVTEDLMSIRMLTVGLPIYEALRQLP